jgi:hypothetical protein
MTRPNEFDPSAYTMNRLGPHVMVEKVSPLKHAVCHGKRSAHEAERYAFGAKSPHANRT